jgi:glycosyltransferase involved in cell wall biosynthesis
MALIKRAPSLVNLFINKYIYNCDDIDIIVSFIEGPTTLLVSRSKCKNKIAWMHTDYEVNHWTDYFFKNSFVEADAYSRYNKIVFVSKNGEESFKRYFANYRIDVPTEIIHNILDVSEIMEKSKCKVSRVFENNKKTIICVGRLVPVKQIDMLIKCISNLKSSGTYVNLIVVGDGSEKDKLINTVSENMLSENVKFLGYQSNPYKYMIQADLYVSSSRAESFPLNIAEALILDIPVIATKNSGSIEISNDGQFCELVKNDAEALFSSLLNNLTDEFSFNILKEKLNFVNDFFDESVVLRQVQNLFGETK